MTTDIYLHSYSSTAQLFLANQFQWSIALIFLHLWSTTNIGFNQTRNFPTIAVCFCVCVCVCVCVFFVISKAPLYWASIKPGIFPHSRRNTFFHKKLQSAEAGPKLLITYVSPPGQQEMGVLWSIAKLTQVVLDLRVLSRGEFPSCIVLAPPDRPEVELARRTLYEWGTKCGSVECFGVIVGAIDMPSLCHRFVAKVTAERDLSWYSTSPDLVFSSTPITLSFRVWLNSYSGTSE